jgi:hypothetical protein
MSRVRLDAPFLAASRCGQTEAVRVLLGHNADINVTNMVRHEGLTRQNSATNALL